MAQSETHQTEVWSADTGQTILVDHAERDVAIASILASIEDVPATPTIAAERLSARLSWLQQ